MLVVSSREFRDNQRSYLDKVDEGIKVLIQRGRDKTYELRAAKKRKTVKKEDPYLIPYDEFVAKINRGMQQYKDGKAIGFNSSEEMHAWLDSL